MDTLEKMKEVIRTTPNKNLESLRELETSIEQLNNEVKEAKSEDIPSILDQLNILHSLANKLMDSNAFPDVESPYFGHLKIRQGSKDKDLFIGQCGFSDPASPVRIVDWKKASLAKVFYGHDIGDEFEFEVGDREVTGTILEKSVLTILEGKLLRIDRAGKSYLYREDENSWQEISDISYELKGGEKSSYGEFGTGKTGFNGPDTMSLLDEKQYELINQNPRDPLLIIGSAGSGKTTVALYRMVNLIEKRLVYPNQSLVLVPNLGLVKLSKHLLEKAGVKRAKVQVLNDWVEHLSRRVFKGLPKKINNSAPVYVQMIKRHISVKQAIVKLIVEQEMRVQKALGQFSERKLMEFKEPSSQSFLQRLTGLVKTECSQIERIKLNELIDNFSNLREDLFNLFTGEDFLNVIRENSDDKIHKKVTDELKIYQTKKSGGFDLDREYLDHQGASDEEENRDSLDQEDFIILLLIAKMKWGSLHNLHPNLSRLRHLILDEAQEVHPFELEIISEFLHPKASLTVAGDAAQQIDEHLSFYGWKEVMNELGFPNANHNELNVSYRSPKNITELAHHVLGPIAPSQAPETHKVGGPIFETQIQHNAHGAYELLKSLRELMTREPKASIAIICSKAKTAAEYFEILSELGNVRLVDDADFKLKPGLDITTVENIRGLEFDYVIIPDANDQNYPLENRARKRLHLAITRAIHQLWILFDGKKTPLISQKF